MSGDRDSRRSTLTRECAEREAERARDPVAYRARLAMERLRDLLEPAWWTVGEATYIFAGLHPELTDGEPCGEWGPVWLPGGRDAYAPREDAFQHGMEVELTLDKLAEVFTGEARPPAEWMKRAVKFGIEPPWLPLALQDETCAPRMPKAWRGRADVIVVGKKRGQAGGEAKRDNDGMHAALSEVRDLHFCAWFKANQVNGVLPRGLRESFIADMVSTFKGRSIPLKEATLRTKMTKWVREAQRNFNVPGSIRASAR